tara:strand:- start:295 stop:912 length:618 start_codon:yes stop_codon:yes gene_type:complete
MDILNLNLLNEQVYITSQVNRIYENMLKEEDNVNPEDISVFKKVLKDMGISTGFIFHFGTGIGAFMRPVTELLQNQNISVSREEVALLVITSFSIMLTNSKEEITKLMTSVKEKGLEPYLNDVTKFIMSIKKIMSVIGEKVGKTVSTLSDVLGFTFMLAPAMEVITGLINNNNITFDSIGRLLGGLILAAGSYGVKNIIDKIQNK